jgi:hypothetical protein
MKLWPFGKAKSTTPQKAPLFANFGIQAPSTSSADPVETTSLPSVTDASPEAVMAASTLQHYAAETPYDDDPFITADPPEPEAPVNWASLGPDSLDTNVPPAWGLTTETDDLNLTPETLTPTLSNPAEPGLDVDVFNSLSDTLLFGQVSEQPEALPGFSQDVSLVQPEETPPAADAPSWLSVPEVCELPAECSMTTQNGDFKVEPDGLAFAEAEDPIAQPWSASPYAESLTADAEPDGLAFAEAEDPIAQPWSASPYAESLDNHGQSVNTPCEAEDLPRPWSASLSDALPSALTPVYMVDEPMLYQDMAASKTFDPYDARSYTAMPVVTTTWSSEPDLGIDALPPTHGLYEHLVQLQARCMSDQAHHTADRVNKLVDRYFASASH